MFLLFLFIFQLQLNSKDPDLSTTVDRPRKLIYAQGLRRSQLVLLRSHKSTQQPTSSLRDRVGHKRSHACHCRFCSFINQKHMSKFRNVCHIWFPCHRRHRLTHALFIRRSSKIMLLIIVNICLNELDSINICDNHLLLLKRGFIWQIILFALSLSVQL